MPTDPTLVAALRDATAAQLREDAEGWAKHATHLVVSAQVARNQRYTRDADRCEENAASLRRLAALALAVARMQERGFGVDAAWFGPDDPPVWFDTNTRPDEHSDVTTLPAALSALLEQTP